MMLDCLPSNSGSCASELWDVSGKVTSYLKTSHICTRGAIGVQLYQPHRVVERCK